MDMVVRVTEDSTVNHCGSVIVMTGSTTTGESISFAGDCRAMLSLVEAVHEFGDVLCTIADWQILRRDGNRSAQNA